MQFRPEYARMESQGLHAYLNMPTMLASRYDTSGVEVDQQLPPYAPRAAMLVDRSPGCPAHWMRSSGKAMSYFVSVKEDHGMWLDFSRQTTPYHVAIVVSVQGVNAVTGLPVTDVFLEQYLEKCPKHDKPFGPARLCEDCGYKWPKQNYLASTANSMYQFWIDGFRVADGAVRQYVLTMDKLKGVAANIIGENRVFAIGLSFFLSKEKKPEIPPPRQSRINYGQMSGGMLLNDAPLEDLCGPVLDFCEYAWVNDNYSSSTSNGGLPPQAATFAGMAPPPVVDRSRERRLTSVLYRTFSAVAPMAVKKVEVGAGARIKQAVYDDPESLDFWRNEPQALIYINYALEADVEAILAQGEIDLDGSKEGFLEGIPAAN